MKARESKLLPVDDLHSVYYERHGNPDGPQFLFLHGGPGAGCSPLDLQYFDLNEGGVILFDQRGCGRSLPSGELRQNTTADLLEDMAKLLDHLGLDKVYLFGGSWGSTLALLFAIRQPEVVYGIVLRGLFLATRGERQPFERGEIRSTHPQVWERFIELVPKSAIDHAFDYHCEKILYGSDAQQREYALSLQAYALAHLYPEYSSHQLHERLVGSAYLEKARLLCHYSINDFFIPDDYISNKIDKLKDIPTIIVQGKRDALTKPATAKNFAKHLPRCRLFMVEAGHSATDPEMVNALQDAVTVMITLDQT